MTPERSSTSSSSHNNAAAAEPETVTHPRRFPVAALAALALVGLFEIGFVWNNRHKLWDANYILLEKKREAMTGNRKPDDVAILGTSRLYHIKPEQLKQVFGQEAQISNYAWGWCGVEIYEAMLRGLIQAGRIPKVIITDGLPELFGYPQNLLTITEHEAFRIGFTQTAPPLAALRTTVGLKAWDTTWEIFSTYMTPPSARYRNQVLAGLKTIWENGQLPQHPPEYERFVEHWQEHGWLQYAPADHVATMDEFEALEAATGPYVYRENKDVAYAYQRFLKLAEKHDIQVIMLPVANNTLLFEQYMEKGIYLKYDEWLHKLERKYENFTAPPPRWFTWPGTLGDAGHLNAGGVEKHMELVVEMLRGIEDYQTSQSSNP